MAGEKFYRRLVHRIRTFRSCAHHSSPILKIMTTTQAAKQSIRADRNLERLFGYYSQPDRHHGRKKQRRIRYWMNVRENAEGKMWRVVK